MVPPTAVTWPGGPGARALCGGGVLYSGTVIAGPQRDSAFPPPSHPHPHPPTRASSPPWHPRQPLGPPSLTPSTFEHRCNCSYGSRYKTVLAELAGLSDPDGTSSSSSKQRTLAFADWESELDAKVSAALRVARDTRIDATSRALAAMASADPSGTSRQIGMQQAVALACTEAIEAQQALDGHGSVNPETAVGKHVEVSVTEDVNVGSLSDAGRRASRLLRDRGGCAGGICTFALACGHFPPAA